VRVKATALLREARRTSLKEFAMFAARMRERLEQSPNLVRAKRAIWATGRGMLPRDDTRIIEGLPLFTPNGAGSIRNRAVLTLEGADRTFPLLVDLAALGGKASDDPVAIRSFANTAPKREAAERLRALFDRFGSDKSTRHDYHLLFGSILEKPDSVTDVLEIGIGSNNPDVVSNMGTQGRPGASLRAFRAFLPRATIYGADVDTGILFEEERINTFLLDQTEPASFDRLSRVVPAELDLIIDDGLHCPHANIATLLFALERLKMGGWFVVEDIAPAALPLWQVISTMMPAHHESQIVDAKGAYLFVVRRSE